MIVTERQYELAKEEAKRLLVYYIRTLWEDNGSVKWDSDNTVEVESIIDAIHKMIEARRHQCPLE